MKAIDLCGVRFGKWVVIEKAERPVSTSLSKPWYWKCRCDCGGESIVPAHNLRNGKSASCGCIKKLPSYTALYKHLLRTSARNNKICELTFEDFLQFVSVGQCHYCHAPLKWNKTNISNDGAYHLDRKDNTMGYTKDNCVACCKRCNFAKGSRYSYSEWYLMNECFRNNQCQK